MADIEDMFRIAVIGEELLARGVKLSGLRYAYVANTTEQVENAIKDLTTKKDVGMIIISEDLVRKISDRKLLSMVDKSIMPVFIEVPAYNSQEKYADTLRRLIIRAIGIDITK